VRRLICVQTIACISKKKHVKEKKCLKYGKSRFIKIVNKDGDKVITKVTQNHLCYLIGVGSVNWPRSTDLAGRVNGVSNGAIWCGEEGEGCIGRYAAIAVVEALRLWWFL
jgi:hypothetical protein